MEHKHSVDDLVALKQRIEVLERENAMLRRDFHNLHRGNSVQVPGEMQPLFDIAQQTVGEYFRELNMDPSKGTIEIHDQRYVLVRASALSKDFLDTVQKLYADRGPAEAMLIGKNFLFDIAHVIGMNDARNFHAKMNLTEPIARLSAGPVHFAYSGWAFVDILPESHPTPDDDFCLVYRHPYSFEADSWMRSGKHSDTSVCIMNSGYSSGWCEESFGIELTAVEVSCRGKGDEHCTFIMSPPHRIQEHIERFHRQGEHAYPKLQNYEIPTFFERKRVEEELQRSKTLAEASAKAKSDFVANMSHELRTPLNAILGFAELLSQTPLRAEQKEYMEAISSAGCSLLSTINDILDLSKLDAGKLTLAHTPFQIPELLHSVQLIFTSKAREQGLNFICHVDTAIHFSLFGDPQRLKQVLVNLVGNAIKFTQQGSVTIHACLLKKEHQQVILEFAIRDTGIGIPQEKLEEIFERFNQGDNEKTRKYGGTGLGLAIARQLIELQGGTIRVNSTPGQGAVFIVVIPFQIAEQQEPGLLGRTAPGRPDATGAKRILLVEDSLMNQKFARIILENNGFEIVIAGNGKEALDILKNISFDLILMDIQMPVMDGCQATAIIRKEMDITTPIIAVTAYALDEEREQCIREGMNDYVAKPFSEAELIGKIRQWLSKPGGAEQQTVEKLISLSFLEQQTGNNQIFIREMVSLFIAQNPKDIANLQKAIERWDFEAIYKSAHALRNAVSFFGLQSHIGEDLSSIERMAQERGPIAIIHKLYEQIRLVCHRAILELNPDLSA